MQPRKNDVALVFVGVTSSVALGLAGYITAAHTMAANHQQFLDIMGKYYSSGGLADSDYTIINQYSAGLAVSCVLGFIMLSVGIYLCFRQEKKENVPKMATGIGLIPAMFIIGGCSMVAFTAGMWVYAYDSIQPTVEQIEAIAIAAGVLGAVAIACFIADFMINRDTQPEMVV